MLARSRCGLCSHACLSCDPSAFPQVPAGLVSLRVRLNTGKTLVLLAALDLPLWPVLGMVEALEGAAPGTMRLTQGGRALLHCARTPRDLGLHHGATLEAQAHTRGGERGHSPMHNRN